MIVDLHDGTQSACVEVIAQLSIKTSLPFSCLSLRVCLRALIHLTLYTPEQT